MKYLSDLLYVDIPTSLFAGEYKTYEVKMISPADYGLIEDPIEGDYDGLRTTEETIYVGTIYGTGNVERIYLNDIIASHVYNNSYVYDFVNPDDTSDGHDTCYVETPKGVLFNIDVYVTGMFTVSIDADPYIMAYYKDAKTIYADNIRPLEDVLPDPNGGGGAPVCHNLLQQRTSVFPRIPKLTYRTDKIWLSALVACTLGWNSHANDGSAGKYGVISAVDYGEPLTAQNYTSVNPYTECAINGITVTGNYLYRLTHQNKNTIVLAAHMPSHNPDSMYYEVPYIQLAEIDECPAPYYLIWIDRTGAFQCQPFNGKTTLSESISTNYKVNAMDVKSPYNKVVTNKWKLNSEWLDFEQYKAYESIFTSKYLYLFNTEYDEGYEVILDTNEWTEKTKQNKDKAFNLQLSLHSARTQNIIF